MKTIKPKFGNLDNTKFLSRLQSEVNEYFLSKNINKTGNFWLYLKTAIFVSMLVVLYSVLLFGDLSPLLGIGLSALLGATLAFIGFNVMHDAMHGSYSRHKWVNKMFGYSLNLMGGAAYFWDQKHNLAHHTYTNIDGVDEDIAIPFMRVHENQPRKWFHRYQFIYWLILYCTTYFMWIFVSDFKKYFSGKIGNHKLSRMPLKEHFIFWFSKMGYFTIFIVLPIINVSFVQFLIGYGVMLGVCGFILSIVFQVAHVVEMAENPVPQNGVIAEEWAIHEVKTTANFATNNPVITWFVGGLNFQIEHHLFHDISHVHYAKIKPMVKKLCKEFDIYYNEKRFFFLAVWSHIKRLYVLGARA